MIKPMIAGAIALCLAGCAGVSSGGLTPAQSLYGAETGYAAALNLAVAYRNLPRCGSAGATALCHDPAVIAKMVAADTTARSALSSAQTAVQSNAPDATQLVEIALSAVQAYETQATALPH